MQFDTDYPLLTKVDVGSSLDSFINIRPPRRGLPPVEIEFIIKLAFAN